MIHNQPAPLASPCPPPPPNVFEPTSRAAMAASEYPWAVYFYGGLLRRTAARWPMYPEPPVQVATPGQVWACFDARPEALDFAMGTAHARALAVMDTRDGSWIGMVPDQGLQVLGRMEFGGYNGTRVPG